MSLRSLMAVPAITLISLLALPARPAVSQKYVDMETRVFQLEQDIGTLTEQNNQLEEQIKSLKHYNIEALGPYLLPPYESAPGCVTRGGYNYCFFVQPSPFTISFYGRLIARFTAFEEDHPREGQFLFERVRLETE